MRLRQFINVDGLITWQKYAAGWCPRQQQNGQSRLFAA
jgi:hypothetical protein